MNSLLLLLIFFFGCTSEKQILTNQLSSKKMRVSTKIAQDAQTFDEPQEARAQSMRDFSANEKRCFKALERMQPALKPLLAYAPSSKRNSQFATNPLFKLATYSRSDCSSKEQGKVIQSIHQGINEHQQKIAVFLPLTGPYDYLGQSILKGIKAATQNDLISVDQAFMIVDSKGTREGLLRGLARVLFTEQPSAIIGGVTEEEALLLGSLSRHILMPALILNQQSRAIDDSEYAFQVYPSNRHLAQSLASAVKSKKMEKITILSPSDGKSAELIKLLTEELQKQHIGVFKTISYQSGDYASMEAAASEITGTEPALRPQEYAKLYEAAKEKARINKEVFQPNLVVLPPQIEVDGVFIPDNFRIVRHFTKIFQYHGVASLPLMGHYEWRANYLISPWEKFLERSFFVDYIGSYQNLPQEIRPKQLVSEFFVSQEEVTPTDFSFIGYRAGLIAGLIVKEKQPKRYQIAQSLLNAEKSDPYFAKGRIFDAERRAMWPTVVFNLSAAGLSVVARYDQFDAQ